MTPRVRVGVIGCGVIAHVMHLPHLLDLDDRFQLSAVCDISEPTAAACAPHYGDPAVYTDWATMIEREPLDAVMVLTSGSHAPAAIAAAERRLHVFVEKPMCLHPEEGMGAFYGLDARLVLTLQSPYLRGMPTELAIERGHAGSAHAEPIVETVSYVEAFKRELVEFHAAITEDRAPRTDGVDGLHDVLLCQAIARTFIDGSPSGRAQ